ncbi:Bnr1p [Acetobacter orientalis]|uniref:Bnr1p n=1 Tax=Acetobacter orientalis TaxID=146474 RepID=A0A2Z5ZJU8_9PROT|nr:Bnr1p [Acetobacter orientalis]
MLGHFWGVSHCLDGYVRFLGGIKAKKPLKLYSTGSFLRLGHTATRYNTACIERTLRLCTKPLYLYCVKGLCYRLCFLKPNFYFVV